MIQTKKNKKGQINQVFIYLVSILIIAFVGFLVVKFVYFFLNDTNERTNYKIYDDLDKDYNKIYSTYGSERIFKYYLSDNIESICFIDSLNCINSLNLDSNLSSQIKTIFNSGDNVMLIEKGNNVLNSHKLGQFKGCFCENVSNNYISIMITNNDNVVYIKNINN
jgi:hypothetical protein